MHAIFCNVCPKERQCHAKRNFLESLKLTPTSLTTQQYIDRHALDNAYHFNEQYIPECVTLLRTNNLGIGRRLHAPFHISPTAGLTRFWFIFQVPSLIYAKAICVWWICELTFSSWVRCTWPHRYYLDLAKFSKSVNKQSKVKIMILLCIGTSLIRCDFPLKKWWCKFTY